MVEAMGRLGLPDKMLRILTSFYHNPQFRVKDREGKSTYRTQRAGIRQGCPLSGKLWALLFDPMVRRLQYTISSSPNAVATAYADDLAVTVTCHAAGLCFIRG